MNVARWTAALPTRVRSLVPLLAMGLVLWLVCFSGLNRVQLIDLVDEGIYASISRQMIDSGDWITPRFASEAFFYKPPLAYWCQAFFIYLLGPTPMAARLPSAIAAFLTAFALYYWAWRKEAMRLGWLAAMLYALCPLVGIGLARVAMMDSLLTLCFTLSLIGWIEGYGGDPKVYLLMAAGVGLATMTKGIIGFLLPSAAFFVWLLIRHDYTSLRKVPWAAALGIFILLVLPWHLAAWREHGNWFLHEYIVRQHVQRFLGEAFGHNAPFWYYLPVLILSAFPWSAFFPIAWWRGLMCVRRSEKNSLDCAMAMCALWAALVVAFFTLSRNKLPNYILPALPALMLLVAWRLDSVWNVRRGLRAFEYAILYVPGILLGILFLIVGISGWQWRSQPALLSVLAKRVGTLLNWEEQSQSVDLLWRKLEVITSLAPYWITAGALLFLGSVAILICRQQTARAVGAGILMSLALVVLATQLMLPAWGNHNAASLKELAERVRPALEGGEPLVVYDLLRRRPSLRYMLGRNEQITETSSQDVLQSVLKNAGRGFVLTEDERGLPFTSGNFRREAIAGEWALWRYDDDDR